MLQRGLLLSLPSQKQCTFTGGRTALVPTHAHMIHCGTNKIHSKSLPWSSTKERKENEKRRKQKKKNCWCHRFLRQCQKEICSCQNGPWLVCLWSQKPLPLNFMKSEFACWCGESVKNEQFCWASCDAHNSVFTQFWCFQCACHSLSMLLVPQKKGFAGLNGPLFIWLWCFGQQIIPGIRWSELCWSDLVPVVPCENCIISAMRSHGKDHCFWAKEHQVSVALVDSQWSATESKQCWKGCVASVTNTMTGTHFSLQCFACSLWEQRMLGFLPCHCGMLMQHALSPFLLHRGRIMCLVTVADGEDATVSSFHHQHQFWCCENLKSQMKSAKWVDSKSTLC